MTTVDPAYEMMSALYEELRRIGRRLLDPKDARVRLQPTDLVHEAAARLLKLNHLTYQDEGHFLAMGARVMRQVIIDEIRKARALKRDHLSVVTQWIDLESGARGVDIDLERLDDALTRLDAASPDLARLVELRFYVGLTMEQIAKVTGQSSRTIKRHWQTARTFLFAELQHA